VCDEIDMNRGKVLESGEQKYVLNDFYILDIIIFKKKKKLTKVVFV